MGSSVGCVGREGGMAGMNVESAVVNVYVLANNDFPSSTLYHLRHLAGWSHTQTGA